MSKKLLFRIFLLVLCMCFAVSGALAEETPSGFIVVREVSLVEGLPAYEIVLPFVIGTNGPMVTDEDIAGVKSVTWSNVPAGVKVTDKFLRNADGSVTMPTISMVATQVMMDKVVTCSIEAKNGTHQAEFFLIDSGMEHNGALDKIDDLRVEDGKFYLRVNEGETVTLPNFVKPREEALNFTYEWRSYGKTPEETQFFSNEPLSYTAKKEDTGKMFAFTARYSLSMPETYPDVFSDEQEGDEENAEEEEMVYRYTADFILEVVSDGEESGAMEVELGTGADSSAVADLPETGDDSSLLLWAFAAIAAALGALLLARRQRSRG